MHTNFGMLGVSREITPFWYEMHTFVIDSIFSYILSMLLF